MLMYAGVCVCLCACVRLEQSTDNSLRFTNNFIIVTDSESTLQNELVFFSFLSYQKTLFMINKQVIH